MAMIDAAVGSATHYTESLADATEELGASQGPRRLCARSSNGWCRRHARWKRTTDSSSAAEGLQAGDQPAAGQSRGGAQREPDRSADVARQPQVFRSGARQVIAQSVDRRRAAGAADDRHRPLQGFNDTFGHLTGDQVLRLVAALGEAERQGPGHRGALWRRGIRHHPAEHDAALGDHGRRSHPPRGDDQGTDEALDRRASRPRHGLDRRRACCAERHRRNP